MVVSRHGEGVAEIPAVKAIRAHVETDPDGSPRVILDLHGFEVRLTLPHARLNVETIGAVDRMAAAVTEWQITVQHLAYEQGVLPR